MRKERLETYGMYHIFNRGVEKRTIFLDESGASGINYIDEVQPYFIQAGVVVQTDKVEKLVKVYQDWENKYKKKNQKEIKSDIFKHKCWSSFSKEFSTIKI